MSTPHFMTNRLIETHEDETRVGGFTRIAEPDSAEEDVDATDFLEASHASNQQISLVVANTTVRSNASGEQLKQLCASRFALTTKLMKNALFGVRVRLPLNSSVNPVVTFYNPKQQNSVFRIHITGAKSWQTISGAVATLGQVVRDAGFSWSADVQTGVDLVNVKTRLSNIRVRNVPLYVKCFQKDWFVPPEDLKPGKPINISTTDITILLWATGTAMIMLKHVQRGHAAQSKLNHASSLLSSIERACTI